MVARIVGGRWRTGYVTSRDGRNFSKPSIVFKRRRRRRCCGWVKGARNRGDSIKAQASREPRGRRRRSLMLHAVSPDVTKSTSSTACVRHNCVGEGLTGREWHAGGADNDRDGGIRS